MTNLSPLCLYNLTGRALVNSGYILPCCFIDYDFRYNLETLPREFQALVDEELKLENGDHGWQLFESPQWQEFFKFMREAESGERQCDVHACQTFCTKNFDQDPTAHRERT